MAQKFENGKAIKETQGYKTTLSYWKVVNMGAIIGQEFTAEDVWEAACKYFQWCDDNPVYKPEMMKSGADTGVVYSYGIPRPYSLSGFSIFTGISSEYIKSTAQSENNNDFFFVAQKVLDIIYSQTFDLAMVGVYVPLFASKALGINSDTGKDNKAVPITIMVDNNSPKLLQDENSSGL